MLVVRPCTLMSSPTVTTTSLSKLSHDILDNRSESLTVLLASVSARLPSTPRDPTAVSAAPATLPCMSFRVFMNMLAEVTLMDMCLAGWARRSRIMREYNSY